MPDHRSDRIVVGVDGSAPSDAALRWGAREAAMRKVRVTLLHVLSPVVTGWGMGYAIAPLPSDYGERQKEEGRRVLDAARRVVEDAAPDGIVEVGTDLVYASPVPTLVDMSNDAQMVVVGSRGQGAWRRGLFGSVSTGLVQHAHCPVAVIRDDADAPIDDRRPVVVGVDGSPASELATAIAFDEASWRAVELVAVHAWADYATQAYVGPAWPDIKAEADETLAQRLAGWQERYPDVVVRPVVERDQAARHLLEQAQKAQLLVVGSHGRGGFAGMLLGSVSNSVVHAAEIPVIVARQH